jgi:hypothetical protein
MGEEAVDPQRDFSRTHQNTLLTKEERQTRVDIAGRRVWTIGMRCHIYSRESEREAAGPSGQTARDKADSVGIVNLKRRWFACI